MGGAKARSAAGRLACTPRQVSAINAGTADALPAERGRMDNASNGPCRQPVFTSGNVQGSAIFA
jgi:hypothetical protein